MDMIWMTTAALMVEVNAFSFLFLAELTFNL